MLQLAVPPRNGRAESKPSPAPLPVPPAPSAGTWKRYAQGPAFLRALSEGGAPRAVWTALPGPHWPEEIARAMAATLASGRGALVVVPDGRSAGRVDAALTEVLGEGRHALLTADSGPEKRYRQWLAVRRGSVRAVVGTRAAMFAPVADLGLVAVWDDGDSSHSDDNAPFPARPGGPRAAGGPRPLRVPAGRNELHRGGRAARRERLGPAPARGA